MSYRIRILRVAGLDLDSVCAVFGLARTTESEDVPESPALARELEDGNVLLWRDDDLLTNFEAEYERIGRLASQAEVLVHDVDETQSYAALEHWRESETLWDLTHEAEQGHDHLVEDGEVPEAVAAFLAQARKDLEEKRVENHFDVPCELFARLGGARYDGGGGDDDATWIVLEERSA